MTKPMIRIHNVETNETVDREMNDAEYAVHLAEQELEAQRMAEADAKALAKASLLDRLGITADEAKLLLS